MRLSSATERAAHAASRAPRLRVARWAVVGVTCFALALSVAGLPARAAELAAYQGALSWYTLAWEALLAAVFFAAAAVITRLKCDDRLAVLLAVTFAAIGATEPGMTDALMKTHPLWRTPVLLLRALALAGGLLLMLCFPTGRFVPRWTRHVAIIWLPFLVVCLVLPATPTNPLDGQVWRATPLLSYGAAVAWFGVGVVAQIVRYRRAVGRTERQQVKWCMLGLSAAVTGVLWYSGLPLLPDALWPSLWLYWIVLTPVWVFLLACAPLCIGIAIARHRLWDVDLVINRTLVYTLLSASITVVHVATVAALGALITTSNHVLISLPATVLAAILALPLRHRLQRAVNQLLYGERDEPAAVIVRLGERLEGAVPQTAMLTTIVETLARALRLPYVAIALPRRRDLVYPWGDETPPFTLAASFPAAELPAGVDRATLHQVPLTYRGEVSGQLLLAPRAPGEAFDNADLQLVATVARQAGAAIQATRLAAELQRSREQLRTALEEERRRLRRDLHDGLGPTLASQPFTISAVRAVLTDDPANAAALLDDLAAQSRAAYADLRRLVYALRPPALDDLGLVEALRQELARQRDRSVQLSFEVPEELPPLSAAIEVAAYRIVVEAVTNVRKHSGARHCTVRLSIAPLPGAEPRGAGERWMQIEVSDDGAGFPEQYDAGVGLASMRERATELRGRLVVENRRSGGARVWVCLPLGEENEVPAIRVLIADDHAVFRYGLRARLTVEAGVEVVGEATTGLEAVALAAELAPDVVVMDLHMPELSGIEATRRICAARPRTHVLVLTQFENDGALAAIQAGARGYVLKDEDVDTVVEAICAVSQGKPRYSAAVDARLRAAWGSAQPPLAPFDLTARERAVLRLMIQGLTNTAIAAQLAVEEHTVRNYVSEIYSKLGLQGAERSRQVAIRTALAAGFGE